MTEKQSTVWTRIDGFETAPSRIVNELRDRKAMAVRAIEYHQTFLDECLRGILPYDLVLLGAPSGIGKTDLALSIASANARAHRTVHYFALEAEPRELERRMKFAMLSRDAYRDQHPNRLDLNYADWLLGKCEHVCADYNARIDQRMLEQYGSLWTYYRGAKFDHIDLQKAIVEIHEHTDLIVIDHLHYVDNEDGESESHGLGETVKTIRDIALRIGKPIILVAHMRKRDPRAKQLIASLDDFHGSSNITKIATQVITIEHAADIEPPKWWLAPTYVSVLKDRRAGAPRLTAMAYFDRRVKTYESVYTLGRLAKGGTEWKELDFGDQPSWARSHRPLERQLT